MDPLSLSAIIAGPASFTADLCEILNAYTGRISTAPRGAVNLQNQLETLSHFLRQVVIFLRSNEAVERIADFERTSVLYSIVTACQQQVMNLYKRFIKFQLPQNITSQTSIAQFYRRLEWPLGNDECQQLEQLLHRYAQTFEFSSTISNCSLLRGTPTQVASELEKNKRQTYEMIDAMSTMMGGVPDQLFELSEKLSTMLECVLGVNELKMEIHEPTISAEKVQPKPEDDDEPGTQFRTLFKWLSPVEPQKRHQDIRSKRLPHTGGWFLRRPEFTKWMRDSDERILACCGVSGAGKSIMTSIVVDHLRELKTKDPNQRNIVLYLYCDYREQAEQSATNMVGALLKQIFIQAKSLGQELVEDVTGKLAQKMRRGVDFELGDVELSAVCSGFDRVFICIDALNECRPEYRIALLKSLEKILHSPGTRLFVTSPARRLIKQYLTPLSPDLGVSKIQIEANREDIQRLLAHEVDKDPYEVPMPEEFREELIRTIADSSQGRRVTSAATGGNCVPDPTNSRNRFLLPVLQIQIILEQPTVARRRCALRWLPVGLNDTYSAIIGRIRSQQPDMSELAMRALMFVSFARRPLKFDELRHALAIRPGSKTLDSEILLSVKYILARCMGLVVADAEASTIRLVHSTLGQYLDDFEERSFFNTGHTTLAETCINYLRLSEISSMIPKWPEIDDFVKDWIQKNARPKGIPPFWEYAGAHWGDHLRVGCANRDTPAKALALDMLRENSQASAIILFKKPTTEIKFSKGALPGSLHVCSYFGLDGLLASLLKRDRFAQCINWRDYLGACPLTWAAQAGRAAAVRLLIERKDVNADNRDNYKRTPLSWAAGNGHESIVRLLVERCDVGANNGDKRSRTPLSWAAGNGHESIVRFLVERDGINANSGDKFGLTPLSWAAVNGHESIVRLLAGRYGISADSRDNDGQTPLSWAACCGHDSIVRFLAERGDVDTDNRDDFGRAPLSWAAQNGHESIVSFLVRRSDVDVNSEDNGGWTALSWAEQNNHRSIVRLLATRGGINAGGDGGGDGGGGRVPCVS